MKKFFKTCVLFLIVAMFVLFATACGVTGSSGKSGSSGSSGSSSSDASSVSVLDESEMFTTRDYSTDYDETTATVIFLADSATTILGDGATVSGNVITISAEGTYILSGTLTNGQVIVNAGDVKLQLVLNGVNINCNTSAALYIKDADKVFVTLADGTTNKLFNKNAFVAIDENNIDAVMYSKEDVTFNGTGSLSVTAKYGHGFVSKDDLVFTSGTYTVTSAKSALNGKDCVKIADGTFVLTSGTDCIHSENSDDSSLGYIYIADGDFTIDASSDGIDANSYLQIKNGTFDIEADSKGVKAVTNLVIAGGTLTATATDDTVHSNGNITITGGTITVTTGDDGIHADQTLLITGGYINVKNSIEGLEGHYVTVEDGEIHVYATDDDVNATGSSKNTSDGVITINGGELYIEVAGQDVDGLDANGSYVQTGGFVVVSNPNADSSGSMSAVDVDNTVTISGGIILAPGTVPGSSGNSGGGMGGGPGGGHMGMGGINSSSSLPSGYVTYSGTLSAGTHTFTFNGTSYSFTLKKSVSNGWICASGISSNNYTLK